MFRLEVCSSRKGCGERSLIVVAFSLKWLVKQLMGAFDDGALKDMRTATELIFRKTSVAA